ncbi:MAG TPA: hypothetical protein VN744_15195 [Casimicrobiaceae bacterium]|jgi:hypothetical protein|nr:hypothetical protein [Casimicrobiaceae bacterium]
MSKNIAIAVGAAIVGALIVFIYNVFVAPPIAPARLPTACAGNNCPVSVSVYGEDCSNPDNIQAAPPAAPIKRGNANPRIEWTIVASSGFTFASNGIDFHGNSQFHNGRVLANGAKFEWFDTNSETKPTPHKYSINLLHNGVACTPLDPGIINGQ